MPQRSHAPALSPPPKIIWQTIAGSLLIFCSWVSQNILRAEWISQRAHLEQLHAEMDIQGLRMEHWQAIVMLELDKPSSSQAVLAGASYKAIQAASSLNALMIARGSLSQNEIAESVDEWAKLNSRARALFAARKGTALAWMLDTLAMRDNKYGLTDYWIWRSSERRATVADKTSLYDRGFLGAFILGSMLLAWGGVRRLRTD